MKRVLLGSLIVLVAHTGIVSSPMPQDLTAVQAGRIVPPEGRVGGFGQSVAVTDDVAVVGSIFDMIDRTRSGAAYVYRRGDAGWEGVVRLTDPQAFHEARFGSSVAISGDRILVGAPADGGECSACGVASVFRFDGAQWVLEARLTAADRKPGDVFGVSVSLHDDVALIGSYGNSGGAAYVFRFDGKAWQQEAKLVGSDTTRWDRFGVSVCISGDAAIISAQEKRFPDGRWGAAYVFRKRGDTWSQEASLVPGDNASVSSFARFISIEGEWAAVSAVHTDAGKPVGKVDLFHFDGTSWIFKQRVEDPHPRDDHAFGGPLSMHQNRLLVVGGGASPRIHFFEHDGDEWALQAAVMAPDLKQEQGFGTSAAVSATAAVIGSHWERPHGAAYVYKFDGTAWALATIQSNEVANADQRPVSDRQSVVYKTNGTGGGDWFDPKTWEPNGVPGTERHYDVAIIQKYDTVTQSRQYPFTLGFYFLQDCATHIFSDDADVAALSVSCDDGRWLREGEIEPLIVVRNAAEANRPRHADLLLVYDCPLFCDLLRDAFPPYDTLPNCTDQCTGDPEAAKAATQQKIAATREANLAWTGGMIRTPQDDVPQATPENFRFIRELTAINACTLQEFRSLSILDLSKSNITDDGLAHLKHLRGLRVLTLADTVITDDAMVYLSGLAQLTTLDVSGTQIIGTGLRHLDQQKELHTLSLSNTPFNDAGALVLSDRTNLKGIQLDLAQTQITDEGLGFLRTKDFRSLNLNATNISDAGLSHLRGMKLLWVLNLSNTKITDHGLEEIANMKGLGSLILENTAVSDEGIQRLRGLPKMWSLNLNGTAVTDACIDDLLSLPALMRLHLQRTRITAEAVIRLTQAKPKLNVVLETP